MAHTAVRWSLAIFLMHAAAAGYEPTLDSQAIADAIAIGQSRVDSVRARFHEPYRIHVARPPVDYIEVVTPFRRVELAAEQHARGGDRRFGQREALAVLAEHRDGLQLLVELTFHPLNAYVGVPDYVVTLLTAASPIPIDALNMQRIPRFGLRVAGSLPYPTAPVIPSGSNPMLGGTLIVSFGGAALDSRGMYAIVVDEREKELARVGVDLSSVR